MNPLTTLSSKIRCSAGSIARGLIVRHKSVESGTEIQIPKRIQRNPTDVLRALANTVKRDPTAAHYKYHDDPFLIPTSNINKRSFAMAQESGRKAAHWIRQEHADLFQHKVADPPIEAYFPRVVYDENSTVDEEILNKAIGEWSVSDALNIYNLLQNKGIDVSRSTKQKLLELVCFYNGEDALQEDWIEERWFKQSTKGKGNINVAKSWKDNGTAEELFRSITPSDSASYSALIAGMALHGQMEVAFKHYEAAKEGGHILSIHVFNSLIAGASVLKESHELRWGFVEEMFAAIKDQGLSPNLGTLNNALETLSSMSSHRHSRSIALKLIAEFRSLGIEPSLASYYHLLNIFCRDRGSRSSILVSILNILEGKALTIRDSKDVFFFTTAMEMCRYHLTDHDLAFRLDQLLHTAENYNLIGDSYKESVYYRHFFALVCNSVPAVEFLEFYSKLVPHVYVPEAGIMEEVIKTVDLHGVPNFLPRLWSDIVMFDYSEREQVIKPFLSALKNGLTSDEKLNNELADVACAIFDTIQNQREGRTYNKISWTGEMLGHVLEVVLRADRIQQSCQVLELLDKQQNQILGVPDIKSLAAFVDYCIEKKNVQNAIWCIQYCYDAGFEDVPNFAQKLSSSLSLTDSQFEKLTNLVGKEVLEKKTEATVAN